MGYGGWELVLLSWRFNMGSGGWKDFCEFERIFFLIKLWVKNVGDVVC